jgi:site-specific DNA recombinase
MKIAIYTRVSTPKQSLENQLPIIHDYCNRMGYEIVKNYEDVCSGMKDTRPQLDEMLQDMRERKFEGIVVYKLDRIGRSMQHLLQLFQEFKNNNIKFISVTQNINTDTSDGKAFLRMMMVFAEFERDLITERTRDTIGRYKKELEMNHQFVTRDGKVKTSLGRPVGSRDKTPRKKSGYWLRWTNTKKKRKKSTPRKSVIQITKKVQ